MQLITFPCQMILTFIILRSPLLVGFTSFLQCCAKWLAKEYGQLLGAMKQMKGCWPAEMNEEAGLRGWPRLFPLGNEP
jgi:hypothetical protein